MLPELLASAADIGGTNLWKKIAHSEKEWRKAQIFHREKARIAFLLRSKPWLSRDY